jgi:hypothetical protein
VTSGPGIERGCSPAAERGASLLLVHSGGER